jgi:addiction module HigA family antidote
MSGGRKSHPGKMIFEKHLKPQGLTAREFAGMLRVSASTLSRILDGKSAVTPEMALRLSLVLSCTAESWLLLQNAYDLDQARQRINLKGVVRLKTANARGRLKIFAKRANKRSRVRNRAR